MFYFTSIGGGTYKYYGDDLSVGDEVAIYQAFEFPVMYRPFYTAMNYFLWDIARVDIEKDGVNVEYSVNSGPGWRVEPKIYNGVTYDDGFSSIIANNDDITGSWKKANCGRKSTTDIDNKDVFNSYATENIGNIINIEDKIGVSGKCWYEHTDIDETISQRVTYSITEGCPPDDGGEDYQLLNTPNTISLNTIAGTMDYDFVDSLECSPANTEGSYIFIGEPSMDTMYFLFDKNSFEFPFTDEAKFVYYAEGSGGILEKPTMDKVDVLYVYVKYNEIGVNNGNNPNDRFFIKIERKGEDAVATFSLYPDNNSEEMPVVPTEYTAVGKWVSSRITVDEYLHDRTFDINGGNIGKKSGYSFERYFSECGIELITTYQYVYGSDKLLSDEYIDAINYGRYEQIITFDGGSISFNPENVFGIGVKTGMTSTRSVVRIFKFYPKVNVLNGWTSGGMKPFLEFEPIDTLRELNMFNNSGGSFTWKVKSNVDWKWNFEYEQSDLKDWLSFMTGNIEDVIVNGKFDSGIGNKQYIVKAKDNNSTDGRDGGTNDVITSYLPEDYQRQPGEAPGTGGFKESEIHKDYIFEKDGKKYYSVYVSGYSETMVYDEDTGGLVTLSAYTRFYLETKDNKSFENINNSISDTYTFGNGGGTVDVKITNNMGDWKVSLDDGGEEWIKISENSTNTGNGDGYVMLIADKNEKGEKKPTAKLTITPYCGKTENYEYEVLFFNMNGAPVQSGGDVDCDNPISFDYTGGTVTTAITANLEWTSGVYDDNNRSINWLSVSPSNGTGSTNITITAESNEDGPERWGHVILTLSDGVTTIDMCVYQEGDERLTPVIKVVAEYPTS